MSADLVELVADRFKILAQPARLNILNALRAGELTVSELADELSSTHANLSKHLHLLHGAGFVERRKEGLHVYYSLVDKDVFKLCDLMCGRLSKELKQRRRALRG